MNIKEIKVERKSIPYVDLVNLVDFAVKNSFGKTSGKYHKYMQDYAETLALLVAFTNYKIEQLKEDELFEEVLGIYHSDYWQNEIVTEIEQYDAFVEYVDEEIRDMVQPLANFDAAIESVKKAADAFVDVMGAIDKDALKTLDFTELANALTAMDAVEKKDNTTQAIDNIVEFKGE